MHQGYDRAGRKPDILKSEPDVDQHTDCCYDHCDNRVRTHLGTYGTADIPNLDILLGHPVVIRHILRKRFSFRQILSLCLEYYLCSILNSLYLNIRVSGNLFQIRNHLAVNLIQRVLLIKCYRSRCTAHEIKAVVHSADSARVIDSHPHESAQAHNNRNDKEYSAFSEEIDRFTLLKFLRVKLLISDAYCIERIDDQPRDDQCGEHGYHDTQSQCLRKSSYCSASSEPQHCCRDQGCNVSVNNCGHSFMESGFQRTVYGSPRCQFFFHTGKDDNIRIDRHTDTKDNTRDTRKGQCYIKGIQKHKDQTCVDQKRKA